MDPRTDLWVDPLRVDHDSFTDLNLGALNLEILKQNNEQGILGTLLGPDGCSLRAVARYGGPHLEAFEA